MSYRRHAPRSTRPEPVPPGSCARTSSRAAPRRPPPGPAPACPPNKHPNKICPPPPQVKFCRESEAPPQDGAGPESRWFARTVVVEVDGRGHTLARTAQNGYRPGGKGSLRRMRTAATSTCTNRNDAHYYIELYTQSYCACTLRLTCLARASPATRTQAPERGEQPLTGQLSIRFACLSD